MLSAGLANSFVGGGCGSTASPRTSGPSEGGSDAAAAHQQCSSACGKQQVALPDASALTCSWWVSQLGLQQGRRPGPPALVGRQRRAPGLWQQDLLGLPVRERLLPASVPACWDQSLPCA